METFLGTDPDALRRADPEVADVLLAELARRETGLQLVASENVTSPAVLAALGSTLADKYAEGYPGRRHHAGCAQADRAEELAVARARALFGAEHVNVQPHSGTAANLAAYAALVQPGDTVLALDPPHGGHLTHGSRANFSGTWYHHVGYTVRRDTELIDLDEVRELAREHRPQLIVCGATCYPRPVDVAGFRAVADEVGAYLMVDAAHLIGLVAGGVADSPVPYADVVTCTTHKVLRGPRGGMVLCRAGLAERIDRAVFPFTQGGPMMHAIAAKAVAFREAATPEFRAYAAGCVANARALVDGLAAAGMRPVTGGTDTHLAVLDLRALGVSGLDAEQRCAAAGIFLGRNALPYDPRPAAVASGLRAGTPCVTSQGMGPAQMRTIAGLVAAAVRADPGTAAGADALRALAGEAADLARAFPPYPRTEVYA